MSAGSARPEELVRVGCFLAAGRSAYIIGQLSVVDGGLEV
jgi:NAD(P)-dependent dehydrogenase (short-subunit alcohol dehydrogenase family)